MEKIITFLQHFTGLLRHFVPHNDGCTPRHCEAKPRQFMVIKYIHPHAFSLVELLISLIIISLITSSLAPVMTKKLKYQNATISSNTSSLNCSKFDAQGRCLMCTKNSGCSLCTTQFDVPEGKYVNPLEGCDYKNCATGCKNCTEDSCLNCKGGYGYNSSTKSCTLCIAGNFSSGGTSACTSCSGNFVSSANGASSCSECKPSEHKYPNSTHTGCLNKTCGAGQYINGTECKTCPNGTYQEVSNHQNTGCIPCPSAHYCVNGLKYPCPSNCISCTNGIQCSACGEGYNLNNGKCEKYTEASCLKIGNICVAKFNAGDLGGLGIEGIVEIRQLVSSIGDNKECANTPICWKGTTASICDAINGGYSGCNRTICTWYAAKKICEAHGWRLPTNNELALFSSYSINKGAEGLQLCDGSGYSSAMCFPVTACLGACNGYCQPYYVWSETNYKNYDYCLNRGTWEGPQTFSAGHAFSVRCVRDL